MEFTREHENNSISSEFETRGIGVSQQAESSFEGPGPCGQRHIPHLGTMASRAGEVRIHDLAIAKPVC